MGRGEDVQDKLREGDVKRPSLVEAKQSLPRQIAIRVGRESWDFLVRLVHLGFQRCAYSKGPQNQKKKNHPKVTHKAQYKSKMPGTLAGWMNKRGGLGGRQYQKRWFVLEGTTLRYYKDQASKEEQGSIDLRGATINDDAIPRFALSIEDSSGAMAGG
eukprot:NODE_2968_length_1078_cov_12.304179_g2722_i0.p1 GENE.NODE_2968_length_1078_cov_12.304179_g2722_i0~~NODE_2968_length_1078_cov_12.304179_g2722_i0.p1  ORF type:complete len:158 (+),score=19.23 NODE_2968_length_1078_cov_12.304179_g2722_i0:76-549(+)